MSHHHKLSASSSPRWILCHGSIAYIEFLRKEKKIPADSTNPAAELGTGLHSVFEHCVKKQVNPLHLPKKILKKLSKLLFSNYDLGGVEVYWDFIDRIRDSFDKTLAEKSYDLTNRFDIDIGGTADVTQMKKKGKLHIGDYKNGRGLVNVIMNSQLLIYALGAYVRFNEKYQFTSILMSIGQPNAKHPDGRVRTYEIMISELLKWEKQYLKPAIEKIKRGTTELIPGPKQCEWCPARNHCEANAKQLVQIAQLDFKNYAEPRQDFPEVQELTREQMAFIIDNETRLVNFCKSVREYATEIVEEGQEVGDYIIQTTLSNRKFVDDKEFKKVIKKHKLTFKSLKVEQDSKLLTVTQLETFLGKDKKWDKEKVKTFMSKITERVVTGKTLVKGVKPETQFKKVEEVKTLRKSKAERKLRKLRKLRKM